MNRHLIALMSSSFLLLLMLAGCTSNGNMSVPPQISGNFTVDTRTGEGVIEFGPAGTNPGSPGAQTTTAQAAQQAAGTASTLDQFKRMVDKNPYEMINRLDRHPDKVNHPQGGFTISSSASEVVVFWTGLYETGFDNTFAGKVDPYRVDGRTGVYLLLPNNTITVPSPSGVLKVTGVTPDGLTALRADRTVAVDLSAIPVKTSATSCVQAAEVIKAINDSKASDPGRIYIRLDEIVNENPQARLRTHGPAKVSGKNTQTLIWVQNGRVNSTNVLSLDQHEGKALYLATSTGEIDIGYPHSGVETCSTINPEMDFPWWGQKSK